ncbi:MAG: Chorismate pyruvate-lyase [Candidatus Celerinatantimonas neptuna]|nr:MAG: Chorismate pyruvate-lyase [Candidatus Celerinatantimonas neptuna]
MNIKQWPEHQVVEWSAVKPDVPATLYSWLAGAGSLTLKLEIYCSELTVDIICSAPADVCQSEQIGLGDETCWQRDVCLLGDGIPWVVARSLWPQTLLSLNTLETTPLGLLLFNQPQPDDVQREIGCFCVDGQKLWARRSIYQYDQHPVCVQELFLPGSPAYREIYHG